MKLLQQLNEASDLPVDEVKERMKKDPRVKILFTRGADFEDVKDLEALVLTAKYYIFNNRNVRAFAESRFGLKVLSKYQWNYLAKLKPSEFTAKHFASLKELTTDLFRDYTRTVKTDISNNTMENVWAFIQGNMGVLWNDSAREIDSMHLGIDQPIRLYRGIHFTPGDFESKTRYDSSGNRVEEIGKAVEFLNSIKKGSRLVRMENTEHTLWTTDKETAVTTSKQRYSHSSPNIRDGSMGFVVSMLATPKDVLMSAGHFVAATMKNGGDRYDHLYVVRPGKYLTRIVHKFTSSGEVDPTEQIQETSDAVTAAEQLQLFAQVFQPYYPLDQVVIQTLDSWSTQAQRDLLHLLEAPDAQEKLLQNYEAIIDFYKGDVAHVSVNDIKELHSRPEYRLEAEALSDLRDSMRDTFQPERAGEHIRRADLTTDQFVASLKRMSLVTINTAFTMFARDERYLTREVGDSVAKLRRALELSQVPDLHRTSKVNQNTAMFGIMDEIHKRLGKEKPASRMEQVANARQYVSYVNVNARIQSSIHRLFNESMRRVRARQLGQ